MMKLAYQIYALFKIIHQDNMSINVNPFIARSETGVCRGISIFLVFAPKHRVRVLIRTAPGEAVLTCTHNQCFEQKY